MADSNEDDALSFPTLTPRVDAQAQTGDRRAASYHRRRSSLDSAHFRSAGRRGSVDADCMDEKDSTRSESAPPDRLRFGERGENLDDDDDGEVEAEPAGRSLVDGVQAMHVNEYERTPVPANGVLPDTPLAPLDPESQPVDRLILDGLKVSKDRILLLRSDMELERFVNDSERSRLKIAPPAFPPSLNSYQRLLVHRLADMWNVSRELEQPVHGHAHQGTGSGSHLSATMVLVKTGTTRIPPIRIASLLAPLQAETQTGSNARSPLVHTTAASNTSAPDEATGLDIAVAGTTSRSEARTPMTEEEPARPIRIMSRSASTRNSDGRAKGSRHGSSRDSGTPSDGRTQALTYEEREAAYNEARMRIFNQQHQHQQQQQQQGGALQLQSPLLGHVMQDSTRLIGPAPTGTAIYHYPQVQGSAIPAMVYQPVQPGNNTGPSTQSYIYYAVPADMAGQQNGPSIQVSGPMPAGVFQPVSTQAFFVPGAMVHLPSANPVEVAGYPSAVQAFPAQPYSRPPSSHSSRSSISTAASVSSVRTASTSSTRAQLSAPNVSSVAGGYHRTPRHAAQSTQPLGRQSRPSLSAAASPATSTRTSSVSSNTSHKTRQAPVPSSSSSASSSFGRGSHSHSHSSSSGSTSTNTSAVASLAGLSNSGALDKLTGPEDFSETMSVRSGTSSASRGKASGRAIVTGTNLPERHPSLPARPSWLPIGKAKSREADLDEVCATPSASDMPEDSSVTPSSSPANSSISLARTMESVSVSSVSAPRGDTSPPDSSSVSSGPGRDALRQADPAPDSRTESRGPKILELSPIRYDPEKGWTSLQTGSPANASSALKQGRHKPAQPTLNPARQQRRPSHAAEAVSSGTPVWLPHPVNDGVPSQHPAFSEHPQKPSPTPTHLRGQHQYQHPPQHQQILLQMPTTQQHQGSVHAPTVYYAAPAPSQIKEYNQGLPNSPTHGQQISPQHHPVPTHAVSPGSDQQQQQHLYPALQHIAGPPRSLAAYPSPQSSMQTNFAPNGGPMQDGFRLAQQSTFSMQPAGHHIPSAQVQHISAQPFQGAVTAADMLSRGEMLYSYDLPRPLPRTGATLFDPNANSGSR